MTTFTKHIEMQFERVGSRTKLAGFVGELRDESGILIHSQSYDTKSQAEIKLDALTRELLLDYAERGLVDTLPELVSEATPTYDLFVQHLGTAGSVSYDRSYIVERRDAGYPRELPDHVATFVVPFSDDMRATSKQATFTGALEMCRAQAIGNVFEYHFPATVPTNLNDGNGPGGVDLYAAAFEDDDPNLLATGNESDTTCACGAPATLVVHERSCEARICGLCFINDYETNQDNSNAWTVEPLTASADDDIPTDAPGDDCPDHGPYGDDECPKCSLIAIGSRVELLGFGRGTVIKTSDDEHLNVFVKFDSVSRFGSKFWFDRSEVCHHAVTLQSIQIEHTIQTNRICADPDCQGPHYTWQCPSIRELLFAPATLEWAELAALQAA